MPALAIRLPRGMRVIETTAAKNGPGAPLPILRTHGGLCLLTRKAEPLARETLDCGYRRESRSAELHGFEDYAINTA